MGRATRWLRGLLGMKKKEKENEEQTRNIPAPRLIPDSHGGLRYNSYLAQKEEEEEEEEEEQNKHAIAVAAATAAAADAAVAAAQAAVEVVKLTSQGRRGGTQRFSAATAAAVKIQNVFRGYLVRKARKALRALKGLVKLQAVVRGYLVRKRTAATLQCMQSLIRAQAVVRSQRAHRMITTQNVSLPKIRPRKSTERWYEEEEERSVKLSSMSLASNAHNLFDGSPKVVEIDTYKPKFRSRSKPRYRKIHHPMSEYVDSHYLTISSPRPRSRNLQDSDWSFNGDECKFSTAQSTLRFASRSIDPPTPTKSICGDGFSRSYNNFPKYMANTESFMAKLRSHSAPKQRPVLNEIMAARSSLSGVKIQQNSSCSHVVEESSTF